MHLRRPWRQYQWLISFKLPKRYYSTVEGFLTSDPLLSNLRRVAGHIMRERGMYNFDGGGVFGKNREACGDSLMNGHWEELIGKVEELLHATDHPDNNYHMLNQHIIQYSSDGRQRFLRLHLQHHPHLCTRTRSIYPPSRPISGLSYQTYCHPLQQT